MRATQLPLVTTVDTVFVLFTDSQGVTRLGRVLPEDISTGEAADAMAAAQAAQADADAAQTSANSAQSTANTALANAATAQSTANSAKVFRLGIACSDETTALTAGTAKVTFRMPCALTLTAVRASLTTTSSSGIPTVDINESGVSILSTKLTIDVGELTSTTAATPPVISDSNLADDAQMTIDIDVAGTGAKGLKVWLIGTFA